MCIMLLLGGGGCAHLAARGHGEGVGGECLAGGRVVRDVGDEVDVEGA